MRFGSVCSGVGCGLVRSADGRELRAPGPSHQRPMETPMSEAQSTTLKICSKCGPPAQPLESFYRNKAAKDGHRAACKRCTAACRAAWRSKNRSRLRAYELRRAAQDPGRWSRFYKKNREQVAARQRAYRDDNPERAKAHDAVVIALRSGRLERKDCEACEAPAAKGRGGRCLVQAHHEDYSRPLDVTWLCVRCHARLHAESSP